MATMVPLKQAAAVTAALLLMVTLAATSVVRHGHDLAAQGAGHECDACHFRHLSLIESDGAPAPSAPELVAHAVPSVCPRGEQRAGLGIRPTRGPPA